MRVLRWAGRLWIGVLLLTVVLVVLLFALRLLLPFVSPAPALLQSTPSDGAAGVLPRAQVLLRFSAPMNPRSVEHALQIDPPIDADVLWSDDNATLTISPTRSLQPAATYHIALGVGALSRLFRPLDQPLSLSFHVAPAPAVLAVLPADGTQRGGARCADQRQVQPRDRPNSTRSASRRRFPSSISTRRWMAARPGWIRRLCCFAHRHSNT